MQRLLTLTLVLVLAVPVMGQPAFAAIETDLSQDFVVEVFPHRSSEITFRDTWGARRSGGRRHRGIDILSPRGTPIVAVAAGTVVFMGRQRLSGYVIRIEHAEGWSSSYMHLNNDEPGTDNGHGGARAAFAPDLFVGADVEAGQLIGWVGDSGNAEQTTPHTHFELKHDGEKLNPYPFLEAAWQRAVSGSNGLPPPMAFR